LPCRHSSKLGKYRPQLLGTLASIAIDLESDPVASGMAATLARPGGNITGVFLDFPDFTAK
jgi:putative ABC transport system substrate-binding protein